MQIDENKIRAYLLREVANANKRIVGIMNDRTSSNRSQYNGGFNEIITSFAGGSFTEMLRTIFDDIEANAKKKYSPYHYFDIDTLYSYSVFLRNIIAEADAKAYLNGRKYANIRDFREGLKVAQKQLLSDSMKPETGYYDKRNPIAIAYTTKNGRRQMNPIKPLSRETFDKKYNWQECRKELEKYIEIKHKVVEKKPLETVQEETANVDNSQNEIFVYKYNGRSYELSIDKRKYFTGQNDEPVISIEASGSIGVLFGVYNIDGSVYHGDLYDLDGNFVEHDGGGETFFPKTMSAVERVRASRENITTSTNKGSKGKSKKYDPNEDENQMKLF